MIYWNITPNPNNVNIYYVNKNVLNGAAMNMGIQMSLNYTNLILFEYIPTRKMDGSCGAI
jgi:hypothetical protein